MKRESMMGMCFSFLFLTMEKENGTLISLITQRLAVSGAVTLLNLFSIDTVMKLRSGLTSLKKNHKILPGTVFIFPHNFPLPMSDW